AYLVLVRARLAIVLHREEDGVDQAGVVGSARRAAEDGGMVVEHLAAADVDLQHVRRLAVRASEGLVDQGRAAVGGSVGVDLGADREIASRIGGQGALPADHAAGGCKRRRGKRRDGGKRNDPPVKLGTRHWIFSCNFQKNMEARSTT